MAKKIQDEDASAPFWLLTMGDMNNLLMVFFIMLFSMLTMDKVKYIKLEEDLKAVGTGRVSSSNYAKDVSGETAARAFKAVQAQQSAESSVHQIEGHYVRLQKLTEGVALTLGSEGEPFDEGDWQLKPGHKEILTVVKRYFQGLNNMIELRGHTSGNARDSVVVEPNGDGTFRIRKFTEKDQGPDAFKIANWSMLAWLRANEVRNFLATKHPEMGDDLAVKEELLRIRADGWTHHIAPSSQLDKERVLNQRVEVVLLNEEARKK